VVKKHVTVLTGQALAHTFNDNEEEGCPNPLALELEITARVLPFVFCRSFTALMVA